MASFDHAASGVESDCSTKGTRIHRLATLRGSATNQNEIMKKETFEAI